MSTGITYTKGGTVIQCDTSVLPRPRPQMAWPIPVFPGTSQSFLALALQTVAGSGTNAVLVTTPAALPGSASGVWTLYWYSYQGSTAPTAPSWNAVPVPSTGLGTGLLLTPPNASTVICYLERIEAGQTFVYGQVNVATPADPTQPIVLGVSSPDILGRGQKAAEITDYQMLLNTQGSAVTAGSLDYQAAQAGVSHAAFDTSVAALTSFLSGLTPSWTDQTLDTPLGTGGGATLQTLWETTATTEAALWNAISAAISGTAGAAAGTAVWGGITGALASQADLVSKFALYALLTGATFTGAVAGPSFNGITGLASVAPLSVAAAAAMGTSTLAARQDHVHAFPALTGAITTPGGSLVTTLASSQSAAVTWSGAQAISNTTNSTGAGTGAFQLAGGAYIAKDFFIGGNLWVGGSQITAGMATFLAGIQGGTTATTASQSVFGGSHVMSLDPSGNLQGGPGTAGSTTPTSVIWSISAAGAASFTSVSSSGQITSTVATGTAPLVIASTTQVANLNASYLQGYQSATAATANTVALRDGSGGLTAAAVSCTSLTSSGAISGTTLTLSSQINLSTGVLAGNGTNGLSLYAGSGSTYDFILWNHAISNPVMTVATGTAVPNFPNGISATTGTFSGAVAMTTTIGGHDWMDLQESGATKWTIAPASTGNLTFWGAGSGTCLTLNSDSSATFAHAVSMGALSATTGTFSGAVQGSQIISIVNAPSAYATNTYTNSATVGYIQNLYNIGPSGANGQANIAYAPGYFLKFGIIGNDTITPLILTTNNGVTQVSIAPSGATTFTAGISATTGTFSGASHYPVGASISGGVGAYLYSDSGGSGISNTTNIASGSLLYAPTGGGWQFQTNNSTVASISGTGGISATTGTFSGTVTAPQYAWTGASSGSRGTVTAASSCATWNGSTYGYGISTNNAGGLDVMANQAGQDIRFYAGTANNASPAWIALVNSSGIFLNANRGIYLTSGAPSTVTDCLYQISDSLKWNGTTIYTTGNIDATLTNLVAVKGMFGAPTAYPGSTKPTVSTLTTGSYIYMTGDNTWNVNQGNGLLTGGSVYQVWQNVGSVGTIGLAGVYYSPAMQGNFVVGAVSAGSIGATSLATQVALINQYISSAAFTSGGPGNYYAGTSPNGTSTGVAAGWAIYSDPQTVYCNNGWSSAYSSDLTKWSHPTVQAEFGTGLSIAGFDVGRLALGKLVGGGMLECVGAGSYPWVCPPFITKLIVTLNAAGAGGGATVSGGGGGGGTVQAILTVVPGRLYTITVGAGGASATAGGDTYITDTTTSTVILTAKGGLSSATSGVAGQGGASCSLFSDGGLPGSNGVRTPPTMATVAVFHTFTADSLTHQLLKLCPGAGGGADISGASQNGGNADSGYSAGGAPSGAGGGGASAMGVGGAGGSAGSGPGQSGSGYGAGGGGGQTGTGSNTGGAGLAGYALLQW